MKGGMSYDISLVRTDGTTEVGLMLAKDKGIKRYERYDDPTLAMQYFTERADYAFLPPEKELAFIGDNHEAGFGLEFADRIGTSDKRYYSSLGADCRFKNMTIAGPKTYSIALPATAYSPMTLTDGNVEIWSDATTLTNWTKNLAGGALARESTVILQGVYSAKITTAGSSSAIYQDMVTWNNSFRGKTVGVCGWVRRVSAGANPRIIIDDGIGTTACTPYPLAGDDTWYFASATRVLDASATRLRIILESTYASGNTAVYFDNIVAFTPSLTSPTCIQEFNDELYFAFGSAIYKLNGSGDGFTSVAEASATITDMEPFTDDNLYIGCGEAPYCYINTSGTLTRTTLTAAYDDQSARYFKNVGGTMYKAALPNRIKRTTNPANGGTAWSALMTVGDTTKDITSLETDLVSGAFVIYIGKEDTAWYLDTSDNDLPLIKDIVSIKSSTQCKNMLAWHNNLYVPAGANSLVEYDSGLVTFLSPSTFATNLPTFSGSIQALAADEEYLFACIDNSTKVEIMAGQYREVSNQTVWAWHPIQEITLTGAEYAYVSNVYKKRLWVSSTSSSDSVFYIPLTTKYGDITADTDYTFLTGGYFITSWLHNNLKADSKAYHELTLTTQGCDANNYVKVEYQTYYTSLTGTWTNIGNFTVSPVSTKYLTSAAVGTMIRFRFTIVTNATTTTPRLINYDCRGVWRPNKRKLITCVIEVGDEVLSKNGTKGESEKSIREAIEEATNKVWPNTFYDIDTTSKNVSLLYSKKHTIDLTAGKNPHYFYDLMFEEISL